MGEPSLTADDFEVFLLQVAAQRELPLAEPWLALAGSKLYWSGGFGTGKHILQFACK